MNNKEYRMLAHQMIAIIKDRAFVRTPPEEGESFFFNADNPKSENAYNTVLTLLLKEFKDELSETTIEKQLSKIIVQIYDKHRSTIDAKRIEEDLRKHIGELHATTEFLWKFVMVVEKATISNEWNFGDISVLPGSPEQLQAIKDSALEFILLLETGDERKQTLSDKFEETFSSHFMPKDLDGTLLLSLKVKTKDSILGRKIALERTEEMINFLRFVSFPIYGLRKRWALGLYGDVAKRNSGIIGIANGAGIAEQYKYEIRAIDLDQVRNSGQDVYFALAAKAPENRSEIENRVMQAIHWIGQAIATQDISHRFLFLFTAIETLLMNNEQSIVKTLSERCAFLIGTDVTSRKNIEKAVVDAYDTRSRITHGGARKGSQDQLIFVFELAYNCIAHVTDLIRQHGWTQQEQLIDYLDNLISP